jgi:GNAT superfamily N-acetyltransferase
MILRYEPIHGRQRGLLAAMLAQSYASLLRTDPDLWRPEEEKWDQFDRDVFDRPDAVGACVFLSSVGTRLVGFGSYDPRGAPEFGRVGHNCILPEFRGRGFGKLQVQEILRRLSARGIRVARVSTLSGAGHVPAQRMYLGCGFRETTRRPWDRDPGQAVIEYERALDLADKR